MVACRVPLVPIFENMSPPERISFDLFDDSFVLVCMDKSFDDINKDFSAYSKLTHLIRYVVGVGVPVIVYYYLYSMRGLCVVSQLPVVDWNAR